MGLTVWVFSLHGPSRFFLFTVCLGFLGLCFLLWGLGEEISFPFLSGWSGSGFPGWTGREIFLMPFFPFFLTGLMRPVWTSCYDQSFAVMLSWCYFLFTHCFSFVLCFSYYGDPFAIVENLYLYILFLCFSSIHCFSFPLSWVVPPALSFAGVVSGCFWETFKNFRWFSDLAP